MITLHSSIRRALLASALALSVQCAVAQQSDYQSLLRVGSEERTQGNYVSSMVSLQAALGLNPADAQCWYELGLLLGQTGDFRGAESAFRKAIERNPNLAVARYNLGLTLIANPQSKLDWPAAITEFREAIRIDPQYAEAHNLLGAGLSSQADYAGAIVELRRAVDLKPTLPEAHFNLGIALEKTGQLDQAAEQYQAAVQAKSGAYPEAMTALGKLYARMGRKNEAAQELLAALALNPDSADANHALASVFQSLEKSYQARVEVKIAQDIASRTADAMRSVELSNSGLESASHGEMSAARQALQTAIQLKPDYGVPHYNLALILADQKNYAGSLKELEKAISLMPGSAKPWLQAGRVLRAQGERDNALEVLRYAEQLAPSDASISAELESIRKESSLANSTTDEPSSPPQRPDFGALLDTAQSHIDFAKRLETDNDKLGAIGELRRALVLDPRSLDARLRLVSVYGASGDQEKAILEAYKILLIDPRDTGTRVQLAQNLLSRGDNEDAAKEFRVVLSSNPQSKLARAGLAAALSAAGKHSDHDASTPQLP